MSNPFLNDAYVKSVLTRKIAALETSTRRHPSQSQVKQLKDLTTTYHGSLASSMKSETALEVLSDVSPDQSLALQLAQQKQQTLLKMLSDIMKKQHDTAKGIISNLRA